MKGDRFADAFAAALNEVRDELITRGWFGRNTTGRGHSSVSIETPDSSASISLGWDFAKEPSQERDGPGIER